jgi:hypothetical protein
VLSVSSQSGGAAPLLNALRRSVDLVEEVQFRRGTNDFAVLKVDLESLLNVYVDGQDSDGLRRTG